MANDFDEKDPTQAQGNNGEGNPNPNPPNGDDGEKKPPKEDNGFVKAAKWTWEKTKAAGRFVWKHKGKLAAIFGTGVITGVVISNAMHSAGSTETTGTTDMELLTGSVDTPLMPDVDANVNVDVDVPEVDVVNIDDYMNV